MLDRKTILALFEETISILVFNLDFIPDDRLSWKPAPDAKSALEIVNHLVPFLNSVTHRLTLQPEPDQPPVLATNREEAKTTLNQAAKEYLGAVHEASSAKVREQFHDQHPFSIGWMITAAALDTIYHAGQIAYIQTLLGDNEIHFDASALPDWAVN